MGRWRSDFGRGLTEHSCCIEQAIVTVMVVHIPVEGVLDGICGPESKDEAVN